MKKLAKDFIAIFGLSLYTGASLLGVVYGVTAMHDAIKIS